MPLLCLKHETPSLTGGMLRETCPRVGVLLQDLGAECRRSGRRELDWCRARLVMVGRARARLGVGMAEGRAEQGSGSGAAVKGSGAGARVGLVQQQGV
ncbi:hypothetical protein SLEP1_g22738 [Rubroshorea leprosula]|uniref:Uncharacterized protein n=1 Tax=Rubroshorea leprosula TaxID=152421 RepID=A0AAV5JFG9_9ROSI|nr:hypothetical protein SLEP1_g22738 [Rubroshorea leprosula]